MNERMVAHELGHVFQLDHGNGMDDDAASDTVFGFDQLCDRDNMGATPGDEEPIPAGGTRAWCSTPHSFMSSTGCRDLQTALTAFQSAKANAVALEYTGILLDPPGVLIPGNVTGDHRTDPIFDVSDRSVDIMRVHVQRNTASETTSFLHRLVGLIPLRTLRDRQYVVFVDLDGDSSTGGNPSGLGFSTGFQGAELVTRVVVTPNIIFQRGPAAATGSVSQSFSLRTTVWRFQGATFQECDPFTEPVCGDIRASVLSVFWAADSAKPADETPTDPAAHVVSITLPDEVRGPMSDQVRIQALAQHILPPGPAIAQSGTGGDLELDRLPDAAPGGPLDGAKVFNPVPPVFPVCLVEHDPAQPGDFVNVQANGLFPGRTVKAFLGDVRVAQGFTSADGEANMEFRIPLEAEAGGRLVTVGVEGTGLSADCFVDVEPVTGPRAPVAVVRVHRIWSNPRLATLDASASWDADSDPGTRNDDVVSYEWFEIMPDGSSVLLGKGEIFALEFSASRVHRVRLVVTDKTGLSGSEEISVDVNSMPKSDQIETAVGHDHAEDNLAELCAEDETEREEDLTEICQQLAATYYRDTLDGGENIFEPGCHRWFTNAQCAGQGNLFSSSGDLCLSNIQIAEWTNANCHPAKPVDSSKFNCDTECKKKGAQGGACVTVEDFCAAGIDSAKCECVFI